MISNEELARIEAILDDVAAHRVTSRQKKELRELLAVRSERAWDLGWPDLVEVAQWIVGFAASVKQMAREVLAEQAA